MNWPKFWKKFILWLIFGIAIPLVAVGALFLTRWFHLHKLPAFVDLLSNGELALVAAVLAAAAAGEAAARIIENRREARRPPGGGMGDLLVIVGGLAVAIASVVTAAVIIASGPEIIGGSDKGTEAAQTVAGPQATESPQTEMTSQAPAMPPAAPPFSRRHTRDRGRGVTEDTQHDNYGPAIASIVVFLAAAVAGGSNVAVDSFD